MFIRDLTCAFVIAVVLTIAFSGVFARRDFRWSDLSLSFLLIVFASWAAGIWLVAFAPMLASSHFAMVDMITSMAVFLAFALIAWPKIRASINRALKPDGAAARFVIVLYFSVTLLLLFSAIVTRWAAVRLF